MKRLCCFAGIVLLLCTVTHAIGLQHGVFRSQSTQGKPWQGTATITNERFDITVYPDYLDVELEWEFKAGGTAPDSFQNAIEIVGNINFAANSSIVSMITWYNGKILKGKLKTDSAAREQYENVVDRSSERPTPPRDPVLLEYSWGKDNYDISIFPATFNGTRQVRIKYLIPALNVNGVNKIVYPYAFSENASVNIKTGAGAEGYIVETNQSKKHFENREPVALDSKVYGFLSYGGTGCQSITYIVPVISKSLNGSTIYSSSFSTPEFSGEMCHVSTMSAKDALKHTSIAEDYVILWRWNHPQIMARYARQIVEQSKLLKKFLSTLESADKRAALIISKEGGETISFHLDKSGSSEFNLMLSYLDSLSKQSIIDPPLSPVSKKLDLECNAENELKEFENAIKAAIDLFEKDVSSLKHLLILTAGPQLFSLYTYALPNVTLESGIDAGLLSEYLKSDDLSEVCSSVNQIYWPGVNISGFLQKYNDKLSVYATVGNGLDTNRIAVLDNNSTATEMHLYSRQPLKKEIRWNIYKDSSLLTSFTETPEVIELVDGMQYARLIGASQHLVPLADVMPSSLASTLGFIDEKYSLVALEEDFISDDEAAKYNKSGVPLLNPTDIFPSPDERADMPVIDWLKANPPVPFNQNSYTMFGARIMLMMNDMIVLEDAMPTVQNKVVLDADVPARLVSAQAQTVYSITDGGYIDYSAALSIKDPSKLTMTGSLKSIPMAIKNGSLIINLSQIGISGNEPVKIVLYNCSGQIVGVWNSASSRSRFSINMNSFTHGSYMLRVSSKTLGTMQQMIVK